jgi:hypothetical protein
VWQITTLWCSQIFYYLLAGADSAMRASLSIPTNDAGCFRYLQVLCGTVSVPRSLARVCVCVCAVSSMLSVSAL